MEASCDVKIASWIKKHYKEEIIFIDPGHVSEAVFAEYISQILKILGLYEAEKNNIRIVCSQPAVLRMPVYGCVRDALQLKWVDNANCSIKKDSWSLYGEGVCLDILEYVRQYSYICVESHTI